MEKAIVNGIELAYARQGQGKPIVLLHGFPLDHHTWDEIVPLLENTFDLIIPDLRGFGESTTIDALYTMEVLASDISGLLDHIGLEKSAIAGHSMGGYVALAFARQFPERINGLGLVSTQALADPPERKEGRYKSAEEVAEKGIGGVVDAMTKKFTSDEQLQKFVRPIMEKQQASVYIGALKAMAERQDSSTLLPHFKFPVTIIHGGADELIPVTRGREMKESISHANLLELNGVGHLPMLEAVQETADGLKYLS